MNEHWLILGASSPMARAFARLVAKRSAALTLVGRDREDLSASVNDAQLRGASDARFLQCDVTDALSRKACIAQADIPGKQFNILVAMGQMPDQQWMHADPELTSRMIEATYSGPLAMLEGLAPVFERQRSGRVVIIGSVAGDRGRRKNFLYGSAKAGLAVYAEGLRARLYPSGATVTLIKPGFVDTSMTWGLPGLFLVASPQACAAAMLRAADRGRAEIYHPFFWRFIMLIIRHIPSAMMKRLNF